MSKIVALIDGSVYAESVCDSVVWQAQKTGQSIQLLHVIGRRQAGRQDVSGTLALGARSSLLEEMTKLEGEIARVGQTHGRALLDAAADRFEKAGLPRPDTRLRIGDLIAETNEALEDADLLVLGKRGEAADFARGHLGSNLERMVRSSEKPILVANRAFKPIKRLLVAYDGREASRKAVEAVGTQPQFKGMNVSLLMIGEDTSEARTKLDDPRRALESQGFKVSTELASGVPVEVISDRVDQGEIDMLLMGAYGGGRLRSFIIGSTTSELLVSCKVPVMLFH